jgi:hypothetical protein
MQDKPTIDELLAAVEHYLDNEIVPNVPGSRGFHGRVAANVIRTVRRELQMEGEHLLAEWEGLDAILGPCPMPGSLGEAREALRRRNSELAARILRGEADEGDFAGQVFAHVRDTVRRKIEVSDPDLLARSGD